MSDRELLEMAAKAAGYNHFYGHSEQILQSGWNPLTDDSDALRLAVALRIVVDVTPWAAEAHHWRGKRSDDFGIRHSEYDDPCAATRRAITRAAAEIGRAMP